MKQLRIFKIRCNIYLKMLIDSKSKETKDLSLFKQKLIDLTCQLLQKFKISAVAFTVIKVVEAMQMLYFLMQDQNQQYHWNYSVVGYFSMVLDLISLDSLFENRPQLFSTILLIATGCFFVVLLLAALIAWKSGWGTKITFLIKLFTPVIYIFFYLVKTILTIPILVLIIISIVPQASQSYNIVMPSKEMYLVGILLLCLLVPTIVYILLMFRQQSPFSQLPYAGQSIWKGVLWALFKTSMVITAVLDKNRNYLFVQIIAFSLGYLFFIIQGHWQVGIYKIYSKRLQMLLIYFSFTISVLRCIDINGQEITTLSYLLPFLIIANLSYQWVVNRQRKSIAILNLQQNDDFNLFQKHILYLINLIDRMNQRQNLLLLEGYLQIHRRQCRGGQSCPCRKLIFPKQRNRSQVKQQFFKLVVNLLLDGKRRFTDEKKIDLLLCLIHHYRTKNYLQAIYSIYKMLKYDEKTLLDRFYFSFYLQHIQRQMAQLDEKETIHSTDVNKYMDYTSKMVVLQNNIQSCTRHHIQFWRLIMDNDPQIKRLQELGTLITRSKQQLREQFQSIYQANPSSIHLLTIYAKFQLQVTNQESYNVKYLQKADAIYKNIKQSKKIDERSNKYNQNANTAVIIISGDQGQLGTIVHTNNLTKSMLGYKRAEVLEKNVSSIMPKIYGQSHHAVLTRYIAASQSKVNGTERIVPALTKEGFMLPVTALTKPLPNLIKGIEIIAFLAKYEQKSADEEEGNRKINYILYRSDTQHIMGISEGCFKDYGINPTLVYGSPFNSNNQLKIKHIFGISFEKTDEGKIAAALQVGEVIITLSTKQLKDMFLINKGGNSSKILDQQDEYLKEGVQIQVPIKITLASVYNGVPLKLLAIYGKKSESQNLPSIKTKPSARQQSKTKKFHDSKKKQQSILYEQFGKNQTDDMKNLKDFKNFISIKREPSAITAISAICIIFMLITAGAIIGLIFNWRQITTLNSNALSLYRLTLQTEISTPELLTQVQKQLITYSNVSGFSTLASINTTTNNILNLLKIWQREILPYKYYFKQAYNDQSTIYNLLSTGALSTQKIFQQALIDEYMSQIQSLISTDLSSLLQSNLSSNLYEKYISSKLNYLYSIRTQYNSSNTVISGWYSGLSSSGRSIIIAINMVMVGSVILWLLLLLPYVLSVTKINNRVLSLFTLIPSVEVSKLIYNCLRFLHENLSQAVVNQQDLKLYEKNEYNPGFKQNFNDSNAGSPSQFNIHSHDLTQGQMIRQSELRKENKDSMVGVQQKFQKMNNSEDRNKKLTICKFIGISILILGFIAFYLLYSLNCISTLKNSINNFYLLGRRPALIRNTKLFLTQFLMNPTYQFSSQFSSIRTLNQNLISQFYILQANLLHLALGNSQSLFNSYNGGDVCSQTSNYNSFSIFGQTMSASECYSFNSGVLQKGLTTGVVSVLQDIRSTLSQYTNSVPQNIVVTKILQYDSVVKYIETPMLATAASEQATVNSTINSTSFVIVLSGVSFVMVIFICQRLIWSRYLSQLNVKIWRTKGLLNLIPMRIITSNDLLKNEFTSGQLEKAVG